MNTKDKNCCAMWTKTKPSIPYEFKIVASLEQDHQQASTSARADEKNKLKTKNPFAVAKKPISTSTEFAVTKAKPEESRHVQSHDKETEEIKEKLIKCEAEENIPAEISIKREHKKKKRRKSKHKEHEHTSLENNKSIDAAAIAKQVDATEFAIPKLSDYVSEADKIVASSEELEEKAKALQKSLLLQKPNISSPHKRAASIETADLIPIADIKIEKDLYDESTVAKKCKTDTLDDSQQTKIQAKIEFEAADQIATESLFSTEDLERLKTLNTHIERAGVMLNVHDPTDELSKELQMMQKLLLQEKDFILSKYKKSATQTIVKLEDFDILKAEVTDEDATAQVEEHIFDANREAIKLKIPQQKLHLKSHVIKNLLSEEEEEESESQAEATTIAAIKEEVNDRRSHESPTKSHKSTRERRRDSKSPKCKSNPFRNSAKRTAPRSSSPSLSPSSTSTSKSTNSNYASPRQHYSGSASRNKLYYSPRQRSYTPEPTRKFRPPSPPSPSPPSPTPSPSPPSPADRYKNGMSGMHYAVPTIETTPKSMAHFSAYSAMCDDKSWNTEMNVQPPFQRTNNYSNLTPIPTHDDIADYADKSYEEQKTPKAPAAPQYSSIPTICSSGMANNFYQRGNEAFSMYTPSYNDAPKNTATIAVRKGNVLEIVPCNEYSKSESLKSTNSSTTDMKTRNLVDHTAKDLMNLMSSPFESKSTSSIPGGILKKYKNNGKKIVQFEDKIIPDIDSDEEDQRAVSIIVRQKLYCLRREMKLNLVTLKCLRAAFRQKHLLSSKKTASKRGAAKIAKPLSNNFAPPPGAPPAHLMQPVYLRPLTPPIISYFHYDPVVQAMYISQNPTPMPPRLAPKLVKPVVSNQAN